MVWIDKCRRDCYNVYRTPPKKNAYPRQETLLVKPQNPSKAAAEAAVAAENVVAETVVASPKTADAAVIAAIAAIVSAAGYAVAKKH